MAKELFQNRMGPFGEMLQNSLLMGELGKPLFSKSFLVLLTLFSKSFLVLLTFKTVFRILIDYSVATFFITMNQIGDFYLSQTLFCTRVNEFLYVIFHSW